MDELQQAFILMGIEWAEVWRLSVDRRTGQVMVVVEDGRKFTGRLPAPEAKVSPPRVKAIKRHP